MHHLHHLQEWHLRLMYMTYEALGVMRISEMFDIVVDYPDSHPAVSERRVLPRAAGETDKGSKMFGNAVFKNPSLWHWARVNNGGKG